jgi:hypothetical protein
VITEVHEVTTPGDWVSAQGALDIKAFYKNRLQLLLLRRFKINGNNCPQQFSLKQTKSEETRSAVQEPPGTRTYLRRKTPTLSCLPCSRSLQRSVRRHAAYYKTSQTSVYGELYSEVLDFHASVARQVPQYFFPHYLINGTIFEIKVSERKMCFDFLYNFCLQHLSF